MRGESRFGDTGRMHLDPLMLKLVAALLVILVVGLGLRILKQPHVVGYLLAGVILGPHGLSLVADQHAVARLGEFGVIFLLFFIGMEASPKRLIANWRVTVIGTFIQISASVGMIWIVGAMVGWSIARIVLLGFVISLSSTAVVLNYLHDSGRLRTKVGEDSIGVLLAQDLAIIPMLVVIGILGGGQPDPHTISLQAIGIVLVAGLLVWMVRSDRVRLPLGARLRADKELQVFVAVLICLGLALITGLFDLSTALGAFLAGMLVGAAKETHWVHQRLEPFRVVFVAIFFVSIGMLLDLGFVLEHWAMVVALLLTVLVTKTGINAVMFRSLGDTWRHAVLAGAVLAQIGEFSFVLAAAGARTNLITDFAYQVAISVIALSLLVSPAWIGGTLRLLKRNKARAAQRAADAQN